MAMEIPMPDLRTEGQTNLARKLMLVDSSRSLRHRRAKTWASGREKIFATLDRAQHKISQAATARTRRTAAKPSQNPDSVPRHTLVGVGSYFL